MMENNNNTEDQLVKDEILQVKLAASIRHAVETKSLFELYAYRIVSHEQFVQESIKNAQDVLDALYKSEELL